MAIISKGLNYLGIDLNVKTTATDGRRGRRPRKLKTLLIVKIGLMPIVEMSTN